MLCGLCRSYRAASSCSSPATSSRAANAAGEACDLGPLFLPSSLSLSCGCGRFSVRKASRPSPCLCPLSPPLSTFPCLAFVHLGE